MGERSQEEARRPVLGPVGERLQAEDGSDRPSLAAGVPLTRPCCLLLLRVPGAARGIVSSLHDAIYPCRSVRPSFDSLSVCLGPKGVCVSVVVIFITILSYSPRILSVVCHNLKLNSSFYMPQCVTHSHTYLVRLLGRPSLTASPAILISYLHGSPFFFRDFKISILKTIRALATAYAYCVKTSLTVACAPDDSVTTMHWSSTESSKSGP